MVKYSNNFGDTNVDLGKPIANFIKNIYAEEVSSVSTEVFASCWLIVLDRFMTIGVGEILWSITEKFIVSVLKIEAVSSSGSLEVYAGEKAASEAALHTIEKTFNKRISRGSFTSWFCKCLQLHQQKGISFYALLYLHSKQTVTLHQVGYLNRWYRNKIYWRRSCCNYNLCSSYNSTYNDDDWVSNHEMRQKT